MKEFIKNWIQVNRDFLKQQLHNSPAQLAQDQKALPSFLAQNVALKNRHAGQRAFILCTGPSIAKTNVLALKGELCLSVSNFYLHPACAELQPQYHLIPNIFPPHTESFAIDWFQKIAEAMPKTVPILGALQENVVTRENLFPHREKFFLDFNSAYDFRKISDINLTHSVPGVQSVTIMCLMVAIYMGISEIYLLGVDHDALFTHRYDYFFDRKNLLSGDPAVNNDGTLKDTRLDVMEQTLNLWREYLELHRIARINGCKIMNATPGSYLDIFPMTTIEEVLV